MEEGLWALPSTSELFAADRFKEMEITAFGMHPHLQHALVDRPNPMVIKMVKLNWSQNERKT